MKIKISVMKKDIESGQKCMDDTCPIALALSRRTDGVRTSVQYKHCYGTLMGKRFHANLPERAQEFIERFDKGLSVKPTSFYLALEELL